MNMRISTMTAAILASLIAAPVATPVAAQGHQSSEFSLGYTSVSDDIAPSFVLGVKSDWAISGAFGLQGNLGFRDSDTSLSSSLVGLHGYYAFGAGNRVGLFFQHEELLFPGGAGFQPTFQTIGLEAMFALSPEANLELYVGSSDIEGLPVPLTGGTMYGMEGSYAFNPSWRARLNYQVIDLEAAVPVGSISEMGIGVDYFLGGGGSGVPLILSADAVRATAGFGSEKVEALTLTVTIPIGGDTSASGRKLFGDRPFSDSVVAYGG
jgi:hypothetical protein